MDDLFENALCGFVSFDDSGAILLTNATSARILGYERFELDSRPIDDILTIGARIFYQTHLFPLLKLQNKADETYLALKSKSGATIPVLANTARRMRDGMMVNDCVFMVMHQRNRFEDEILAAKKAAEFATMEKTQAYERLNDAHKKLEEQAAELEMQAAEVEAQQDELVRINNILQEDLIAHRIVETQLRALLVRDALIADINRAILESTSAETIQQTALARLGDALQVDRCFFMQFDTATQQGRVEPEWRRPKFSSVAGEFNVSDSNIDLGKLYTQNAPLVVEDVNSVSQDIALPMRALGLRSMVGIGLFGSGQFMAVLTMGMAETPRIWTADDIVLAQAVASQVRSTMETVRVRQRERNIAKQLQEALRPTLPHHVSGLTVDTFYRSALDEAEIGGDFYDVFSISQECLALVVADVSGKGLEAAAQIASVRYMLRALLYQSNTTLAESIIALNDMLADNELLSGFVTLFVGLYDAERRCMEYVSCGQEPGLIRRAADGAIEYLNSTGPVLGAVGGVSFTQECVDIANGDVLALFTDGLTEAGLNRSKMLGIEGMVEILQASASDRSAAANEIASRIIAQVLDRVTPAGIRDDVCLLVARIS